MATNEDFLNFPNTDHCTGVFSLGEPGGGKSYIMLQCLRYWIQNNFFKEYHLILPSYKNEMNDSYAGLAEISNVFIYESYHQKIASDLLKRSDKDKSKSEKYFLCVDDASSQGKTLMQFPDLIAIATQGRHYRIQSWFLMHHTKGIIPPKVRSQTKFTFFYNMHVGALKDCFREYVNFSEFRDFKLFLSFWDEYVISNKYGCLLIKKMKVIIQL